MDSLFGLSGSLNEFIDAHVLLEMLLLGVIVYLLLQKSYKPKRHDDKLTEKEITQLCEEWTPEPLIPAHSGRPLHHIPVVTDARNGYIVVDGKRVINAGTFDFLSFLGDKEVEDACDRTLAKYGCGSCGPRGFYGTIDVHLNLESDVAKFLGTDQAIIYSFDLATISSVIPAFASRGDLILYDEEVSYPIQQGLFLSRSVTRAFKHNDMNDLERLMLAVKTQDERSKRPQQLNRRFVCVEGIYLRTGTLTPLREVVALCKKYRYRLILDESISFGTLGASGRGATEHWGVDVADVDMLTASMSNALGTIGGFCAGSEQVVDHQRLSGLGYCFSASLPPFNAVAASTALHAMGKDKHRVQALQRNTRILHQTISTELAAANRTHHNIADLVGQPESPMLLLRLSTERHSLNREDDEETLREAVRICLDKHGVAITVSAHTPLEKPLPPPSLRVCTSAAQSEADVRTVGKAVVDSLVNAVLSASSK